MANGLSQSQLLDKLITREQNTHTDSQIYLMKNYSRICSFIALERATFWYYHPESHVDGRNDDHHEDGTDSIDADALRKFDVLLCVIRRL